MLAVLQLQQACEALEARIKVLTTLEFAALTDFGKPLIGK
jgi:hypothetical protein